MLLDESCELSHFTESPYCITFHIDNLTRMTWINMLKQKSAEAIGTMFANLRAEVEKHGPAIEDPEGTKSLMIRRFRCDNGTGEYINELFINTLRSPSACR